MLMIPKRQTRSRNPMKLTSHLNEKSCSFNVSIQHPTVNQPLPFIVWLIPDILA